MVRLSCFKYPPYRLQALVARTLEIDQGPYDSVNNSASLVGQWEAIAIAANLRDANKQRGDTEPSLD